MGSSLPVHKRVGYLSLVPYCKSTIDDITDGCMLMIRFLCSGTIQPISVPVKTGPGGLKSKNRPRRAYGGLPYLLGTSL